MTNDLAVVTRRPARRLLLGVLAWAVLLMLIRPAWVQAVSNAESGNPHLHSGSMSGPGWVSYVFRTNGHEVSFEIGARGVQLPVQVGAFVYDANSSGLGDKLVFSWTYLLMDTDDGILVDSRIPRTQGIHADTRVAQSTRETVTVTVTMNDENNAQSLVGKYRVLMWTAGEVDATDYSLHGKGSSQYLGHETGDDTFLYTSADFKGPLNAQIGTGTTEARVNKDLSFPIEVGETFIGLYYPVNTPSEVDQMWADTPRGEKECPCFFSAFTESFNGQPAGPGEYTFHLDGAHAAPGTESEIVLAGADARLSAQTVQE